MSKKTDKQLPKKAFTGSCYSEPYMSFEKDPDDHYITWCWGTYPGDKNKGTCTLNQRGLEQMPIVKRKRLLSLLAKAQRGGS